MTSKNFSDILKLLLAIWQTRGVRLIQGKKKKFSKKRQYFFNKIFILAKSLDQVLHDAVCMLQYLEVNMAAVT